MDDPKLLKGKIVAQHVNQRVEKMVQLLNEHGVQPKLSVVLVGDDPASKVYVKRKGKSCEKLGIKSETIQLPDTTTEGELLDIIEQLNKDTDNHGILVQLPLPKQIREEVIIRSVNPLKDVDCFHPQNVGLLVTGNPYVLPCTPAGILEILKYYEIETEGKHAVIIGRSNIVGKPLANLLVQKQKMANATVSVIHSRTKDLAEYTRQADILIAAIGKAEFVHSDMIKDGTVVIDVGINRVDADNEKGYRLVGDVNFDSVFSKVARITPVPGGVGPMTIAMLMQNTITAASFQEGITIEKTAN
ncbi:MAG: bifunctional methylenetetrahydrofolate dehydrogenase/methenyltetrahydrofolate cyclohydrolase FolD [Caldithrix sp.]|nr:bifunctional methylenetetrahydrofolate dehydrogenase/methenyltetrahydrofolate cyclohydrolase FolD [Caldithrix sp.]